MMSETQEELAKEHRERFLLSRNLCPKCEEPLIVEDLWLAVYWKCPRCGHEDCDSGLGMM